MPVVVGALGVIKKGTEQHLCKIPGSNDLHEIQKTGSASGNSTPSKEGSLDQVNGTNSSQNFSSALESWFGSGLSR